MSLRSERQEIIQQQLKRRYARDRRFKAYCVGALSSALLFLVVFFGDMITTGVSALKETEIQVTINWNEDTADYPYSAVPEEIQPLVSRAWLRNLPRVMRNNPELMGTQTVEWALADSRLDQYMKGKFTKLDEQQQAYADQLNKEGRIKQSFNTTLFTNGDSKIPEYSGLASALMGSVLVLILTLALAFPVGVLTAVYLEEYAPDNWFTRVIEININNLAAVPSIIFGLLGLAIFINFMGVPRSSAIAGGLTLGLMTLPVIIISTRAALRAVPDSIRQGAYGLGCSRWRVVRDHVLPSSLPGIFTGTIIGLAQAMGETGPRIMIGMIAFIPDIPTNFTQAATVLPAQIFTWFTEPEQAYQSRTAAGILVLLTVMISMNATAVYLRHRFQRNW